MKILFISRMHIGLSRGGLQLQIQKTAEGLRSRGHDVILLDPWRNQLPDVDVCHCFSSFGSMRYHVEEAQRRGKPVIISPVFGNSDMPVWRIALMVKAATRIRGFLSGVHDLAQMLAQAHHVIALNGEEHKRLIGGFGLPASKLSIVPNGIDPRFAEADPGLFSAQFDVSDFVLQVGSVDPNKNQLVTIEAMRGLPYPLVIIGGGLLGDSSYLQRCRASAGENVLFTGPLRYEDPLLASAYKAARVFVLASHSEVMPLSLYEAAAAGCKLLVSQTVAVNDCIADRIERFRPDRPDELRQLVRRAMTRVPGEDRAGAGLGLPTWQDVSDRIAEIYEAALAGQNHGGSVR